MALPSLQKVWIFKTNIIVPQIGSYSDHSRLMWYIKDALVTASGWTDADGAPATNTHPWVVMASSNGVVANTNDNWTTTANVIATNPNFSWIVLEQTAVNTHFQIAFGHVVNTASAYLNNMYVSHQAGFTLTGLVTTAYPAATDRVSLVTGLHSMFGNSSGVDWVLHVLMSTDGQCTRVIVCSQNAVYGFWLFDVPKNPVDGWTNPSVAYVPQQDSNPGNWASSYVFLTDSAFVSGYVNSAAMWMYVTGEFYISAAVGETQVTWNQISHEWPMTPLGLVSATPGAYGRHGELFDLWFTSNYVQLGDSFPDTGDRVMMCIPSLVLPWNKSDFVSA
jgi:hypothetical protein